MGDGVRYFLHSRRARKAGHDDGRFARQLGDVTGNDDVRLRELGASGRIDIEADHMPAAIDQISSYRAAHDAEADDPDDFVHIRLFPTR
jgi:hypothetical protein